MMHPSKVRREHTKVLTDLPNVGPAVAKILRLIGVKDPAQLIGADAFDLYTRVCEKTGTCQDPCLLDTFMSIVSFMNGAEAQVWWAFTSERKAREKEKR